MELTGYTPEVLSHVIRVLRMEYVKERGVASSYYEINNGLCVEFADEVLERMNGYDKDGRFFEVDGDSFSVGLNGEEDRNDVWDMELLEREWNIKPPHGLSWAEINEIPFGHHRWIVLDKRHYDAESPEGVDNFFDLPLFKIYIDDYIRKKIGESK